uniref:peptidylprolyl isomerase n=1 Tax=Eptatretus burgeri TaxID=7764 RepID=A0A8C4R0H1_EPTBU
MHAKVVHCSLRAWPRMAVSMFAVILSLAPGEAARRAPRQRIRISLQVETLFKPTTCWQKAWIGDVVRVRHTERVIGGLTVTSSEHGEPLQVQLGSKKIIPGADEGILGMCIGERRRLIIPPHLAYGSHGRHPTIPGGAMIEYEVELLTLEKASFLSRTLPIIWKLFLFLVLSVLFITGLIRFLGRPWRRSKGSQEGPRCSSHRSFKRKKL